MQIGNVASPGDTGTLGNLPDSIINNIIERLKVHQRVPLRASCKRLRQLVNQTVSKIKLDPTHSEDALRWELSDRFPKLEHIEIMKPSEIDCFTDQTFAQLALKDLSRLPGLTSLNLEHCTQLSVAGLAALALACPRIAKLQIPQVCQLCMSDSMLLVLARLPELSRLRVQCCRHCDEVALAYLSDLRRLTALELEDYGQALRQMTLLTSLTNLRSVMVWSDFIVEVTDPGGGGGAGGAGAGAAGGWGHHGGGGGGPGAGGGGGGGHHFIHHPMQNLPNGAAAPADAEAGLAGLAGLAAAGVNPIMAAADLAAAAVANLNLHAGDGDEEGGGGIVLGGGAGAGPAAGGGGGGGGLAAAMAALQGAHGGAGVGGGGGGADPAEFAHQLQLTQQVLSNIFAGKAALLDWVTGMTSLTHIDIQRVDISFPELQRFTALPSLQHLGVGDLALEPPPGTGPGAGGGGGAGTGAGGAGGSRHGGGSNLLNPGARPLCSVTKLVSHNILHEASLRTTFPALGALSCDSSDSGLRAISELTGLVNLFLWTSPTDAITDSGLAALSNLRRLETFRLEGAEAVTDMGWLQFARGHSALSRVDLVKVPGVTDIGFILSLRQLPGLQRASFMECPGIDTPTLAALLAFCPALEHIELQDCPAISLAALRKMLAATGPSRPDLDIVFRRGGATRVLHGSG
ncbi:hypothetical protein HYH02_004827 [Chlamydomonas schloesseri]|uniref:F-box domain-containing protein n=1 Tax=Chlamydomonas schloesseri TaxID=2026947 RepID=A0A836B7X0_9CHLO|nr:hypothetical protein HYH02_004827 [Chlamydomonas schloesseri]|eukprot:KAG2450322.1 hypothetical protein HYH02_004827 [Chlamydomonas schloesseri]